MLKRIFLKVHVTLKDPMYNLDIKLKKKCSKFRYCVSSLFAILYTKRFKVIPTLSYMYKRFLYVLNFSKAITLVKDCVQYILQHKSKTLKIQKSSPL